MCLRQHGDDVRAWRLKHIGNLIAQRLRKGDRDGEHQRLGDYAEEHSPAQPAPSESSQLHFTWFHSIMPHVSRLKQICGNRACAHPVK
jgi:hypothetical protein